MTIGKSYDLVSWNYGKAKAFAHFPTHLILLFIDYVHLFKTKGK